MKTNYVVIIVHSFDADVTVYEFGDDYDRAKEYLYKVWKEYYETEKEEGSLLIDDMCFYREDSDYGKVTWADECTTEFILSYTSNPNE